jgi:hypothetical protein
MSSEELEVCKYRTGAINLEFWQNWVEPRLGSIGTFRDVL